MAEVDPVPFGELLPRYRAAAPLTQEQLAQRARLSPDAVAALEHGRRQRPRATTVYQLAEALALPVAQRTTLLVVGGPAAQCPATSGGHPHPLATAAQCPAQRGSPTDAAHRPGREP